MTEITVKTLKKII